MEDYINKRIAELEAKKQELIEIANQSMADASAINGGIFELQQMLIKIGVDKDEAAN